MGKFLICVLNGLFWASHMVLMVKRLPANGGDFRDAGLIPGSGRSLGGWYSNPLQYSCLENPHGQRSLVGYSPWGCKELDTTEQLTLCNLSVQFSSVAKSCLTLCDPMNRSMPGLPVHHQLPESTQTHVHCVGDAIQSSHPLSSRFPPALSLSQHQGLFK